MSTQPTSGHGCACRPTWPALEVRLDDGERVDVVPAATPGGLACLYEAFCARCGTHYPHPFRVAPRTVDARRRDEPAARGRAA